MSSCPQADLGYGFSEGEARPREFEGYAPQFGINTAKK